MLKACNIRREQTTSEHITKQEEAIKKDREEPEIKKFEEKQFMKKLEETRHVKLELKEKIEQVKREIRKFYYILI